MQLVALGLLVGLLTLNHKWAGIDPHNPAAGPSWFGALASSVWVTALLIGSVHLLNSGLELWAALMASFALGSALAPSISTPYRLTAREEPSRIARFLESVRVGAGGAAAKAVVVGALSSLAVFFGFDDAAFWIAGLLALILGLAKAPVVVALLDEPAVRSDFEKSAHSFLAHSVGLSCAAGTVALLAWMVAVHPIISANVKLDFSDYLSLTSFALGMVFQARS